MLAPHHGTNGRCFSLSRKAEQRWKENKSSREIIQTEAALLLLTTSWQKLQLQKAQALDGDITISIYKLSLFPKTRLPTTFSKKHSTQSLFSIHPSVPCQHPSIVPVTNGSKPSANVTCKGQGTNKGTHWVLLEADWLSAFTSLLLAQCKEMNQHFLKLHQTLIFAL